VESMSYMFANALSFNQPIGNWDTSSVKTMSYMFSGASSFNKPIGSWDVSNVINMRHMFFGVNLSISNYDQLLITWSDLDLHKYVIFDAGQSKYSDAAIDARDYIINTYGWTVNDGGYSPVPSPPRFLQASAGNAFVYLEWLVPNNSGGSSITAYNIYRSTTRSIGYTLVATVYNHVLCYNDSSVTNDQTYYYVVRAVNSAGESDNSNEVSARPISSTITLSINMNTSIDVRVFLLGIFALVLVRAIFYRRCSN